MNKKLIALGLSVLTALTLLSGCGGEKKEAAKPALKELKVTYVKSPLNIPSIVDKHNQTLVKEFGKDKITVTFPELIPVPSKRRLWPAVAWMCAAP